MPKSRRLLRPAEFRQVYEHGFRLVCRTFVAFCWEAPSDDGPKIGFTATRALGKSVRRNRMRRRLREIVRRELSELGVRWRVVFNVRKPAFDAPHELLRNEVRRVMERCKA